MSDDGQLVLTSSEMKTWLTCPRGWWLTHYLRLRRRHEHPALPDIGNHVHAALERYYEGRLTHPSELVAERAERFLEEFPELAEEISKSAETSTIMLDGYIDWVQDTGADAGLEFIAAEQTVVAPVGPYLLRGKIDARFRQTTDGALIQLEHKTVGNLSDHPDWAQSNPQFLSYSLLAFLTKPEGVRTDGVLINMLRRVKRSARAKPPFYGRHPVRHTVEELRSHYKHIIGTGYYIEQARKRLNDGESFHIVCPPNPNRNHRWSCACSGLNSLPDDDADLDGYLRDFYEVHDPNARYEEGTQD